jgi:conjugal transfer mating pair stabilization protein TraN
MISRLLKSSQLITIVVLMASVPVFASTIADRYAKDTAFAQKAANGLTQKIAHFNPNQFYDYTNHPPSRHLYQAGTSLTVKAFTKVKTDPVGQAISKSFAKNAPYKINPKSPGIVRSSLAEDDAYNITHGISDQYINCKKQPHCHTTYTKAMCIRTRHEALKCTKTLEWSVKTPPISPGGCHHLSVHDSNGHYVISMLPGANAQHECTIAVLKTFGYRHARGHFHLPKNEVFHVSTLHYAGSDYRSGWAHARSVVDLSGLVHLVSKASGISTQSFSSNTNQTVSMDLYLTQPFWFGVHWEHAFAWINQRKRPKPVITTHWVTHCDQIPTGFCHVQTPWQCTEGAATKIIDGVSITKPCWMKTQRYACGKAPSTSCGALTAQGCSELNQRCVLKMGDYCVKSQITMQCPKRTCQKDAGNICGGHFFCMDGGKQCYERKPSASQNFGKNVSEIGAAAGAGRSLVSNQQTLKAFSGRPMKCSLAPMGFLNCCADHGWGKHLGLSKCSNQEKQLGLAREKGLAVYVGKYCAHKTLGYCTSHKKSFCVFDGLMAKDVQVSGRRQQLGIGFGSKKHPSCDGLTIKQLQRIDFGKIDFSNLYRQMASQTHFPNKTAIEKRIQQEIHSHMQHNMPPSFNDKGAE